MFSDIVDKCYISKYQKQHKETSDVILIFQFYTIYFIIEGENLVIDYLKTGTDYEIKFIHLNMFDSTNYIEVNYLPHGQSDKG